MSIVFFSQSCGARFEVEARMAGKRGRCKKCGQLIKAKELDIKKLGNESEGKLKELGSSIR